MRPVSRPGSRSVRYRPTSPERPQLIARSLSADALHSFADTSTQFPVPTHEMGIQTGPGLVEFRDPISQTIERRDELTKENIRVHVVDPDIPKPPGTTIKSYNTANRAEIMQNISQQNTKLLLAAAIPPPKGGAKPPLDGRIINNQYVGTLFMAENPFGRSNETYNGRNRRNGAGGDGRNRGTYQPMFEDDGIPAAGYTGYIPGMHGISWN